MIDLVPLPDSTLDVFFGGDELRDVGVVLPQASVKGLQEDGASSWEELKPPGSDLIPIVYDVELGKASLLPSAGSIGPMRCLTFPPLTVI